MGGVIVTLLVLGAAAGGWWYLNNRDVPSSAYIPVQEDSVGAKTQAAVKPAPTPKTTTQPTPAPAISQSTYVNSLHVTALPKSSLNTASWPTYTDGDTGLSFKYDPVWKVTKTSAGSIFIGVDTSSTVNIAVYREQKTLEDHVRSALNERCIDCVFRTPVVNRLPNGKYAVEVYAHDTRNDADMRPGDFYFGDDKRQFWLHAEGSGAGDATIAILSTLLF